MATVSHASLTADADLHEPKGAAAAAANTVYIADGAGSGSFQNPLAALSIPTFTSSTYNPEIFDGTNTLTSLGGSYSTRTGRYIKLGDWVFVLVQFNIASKGSMSVGTHAGFTLPVTATTLSTNFNTDMVGGFVRVRNTNVDTVPIFGLVGTTTSALLFRPSTPVLLSEITNGSIHSFIGMYKAAS